jgi:hypothetical protein
MTNRNSSERRGSLPLALAYIPADELQSEAQVLPIPTADVPVDSIAHVIQVALTPVFLLSGIGTLLNVFNTRLARVSDHTEHTADMLRADPDDDEAPVLRMHLRRLRRRVLALDVAIALGALGGAATCGAALALFVGVLHESATGSLLFGLFGFALGCTVGALGAFIGDSLLAWHGLRTEGALPHLRKTP